MKLSLIDKCKKEHRVTVPREYLEELEAFYKENMQKHYNMRGDVKKVMETRNVHSVVTETQILFITDNDIKADGIIIVDEEGRERGKFIREDWR